MRSTFVLSAAARGLAGVRTWADRHPVWAWTLALLLVLAPTAWETYAWVAADYPVATWHHRPPGIEVELVHAHAARAGWKELWSYWTGRIIHGNDYYQPLTSWLFVAEQRLWGADDRAWTMLNVVLHPLCTLVLAGVGGVFAGGSLLRRLSVAVLTGWLFGAPAFADRLAQGWIVCWWPVQPDLLALLFSLLLLACAAAYARSGYSRLLLPALLCFCLGVWFKETAYTAGVGACLLLLRRPRRWGGLALIALAGIALFLIRWRALGLLAFGSDNQPYRAWFHLAALSGQLLPADPLGVVVPLGLLAAGWFLPTLFRRKEGPGVRAALALGLLLLFGAPLYGMPWEPPFSRILADGVERIGWIAYLGGLALVLRRWPFPELLVLYALNQYLAWSFPTALGWHLYWSDAFACLLSAAVLVELAEWAGRRVVPLPLRAAEPAPAG